jgi:hypothetical protein
MDPSRLQDTATPRTVDALSKATIIPITLPISEELHFFFIGFSGKGMIRSSRFPPYRVSIHTHCTFDYKTAQNSIH